MVLQVDSATGKTPPDDPNRWVKQVLTAEFDDARPAGLHVQPSVGLFQQQCFDLQLNTANAAVCKITKWHLGVLSALHTAECGCQKGLEKLPQPKRCPAVHWCSSD